METHEGYISAVEQLRAEIEEGHRYAVLLTAARTVVENAKDDIGWFDERHRWHDSHALIDLVDLDRLRAAVEAASQSPDSHPDQRTGDTRPDRAHKS